MRRGQLNFARGALAEELVVDSFAGGGGASTGIEVALRRPVDIAINHDPQALALHEANHPETLHFCESIFDVDPREVCGGRPVGMLWASPDCTHFSKAKGGKPRKKAIRGLAWVVLRWAAQVRPRCIFLENVEEFQDWGPLTRSHRPCPRRKGKTFERWVSQLEALGYTVEYRVLTACDYGAPTSRKRLFLIARCDGQPIVWPAPTHGPGREHPYRPAADCIDWSIPCPSIFERKKPLAEKTLRRIARGMQKYVIEADEPFIVETAAATLVNHKGQSTASDIEGPAPTITAHAQHLGVASATIVPIDNQSSGAVSHNVEEPLRTVTQENRFALVSAFLAKHYGGVTGHGVERPLGAVTAVDHHSVVAATMVNVAHHDRGQPRTENLQKPLPTTTSKGTHALTTAYLTKFYGTNIGSGMDEPVPTITSGGMHLGEVRAFLIKYYGVGTGQAMGAPMHTVTSKDRLGLVTVHGEDYQIVDIGLRMLQPRELARAQGFPDDYALHGTKKKQVAMIGNSVPPCMAEVLVRANYVASRDALEGVA